MAADAVEGEVTGRGVSFFFLRARTLASLNPFLPLSPPSSHFRGQRRHARPHQGLRVRHTVLELLGARLQLGDGHLAGLLVPFRDAERVDAPVQQPLRLLQQGARQDDHPRRAVPDFVVLGPGQLHQQAGDLVLDVHLVQDGGAIVGWRGERGG